MLRGKSTNSLRLVQAKAKSVFQGVQIHAMLVPALLERTANAALAARKAALMRVRERTVLGAMTM
jgi:hypothetical protein